MHKRGWRWRGPSNLKMCQLFLMGFTEGRCSAKFLKKTPQLWWMSIQMHFKGGHSRGRGSSTRLISSVVWYKFVPDGSAGSELYLVFRKNIKIDHLWSLALCCLRDCLALKQREWKLTHLVFVCACLWTSDKHTRCSLQENFWTWKSSHKVRKGEPRPPNVRT